MSFEDLTAKARERVALAVEREEVRVGKEVYNVFQQYPSADTLIQWKRDIKRYRHIMEVLFSMDDEIILQIESIDNDDWQGYLVITTKQEIEIKIATYANYQSCDIDKANFTDFIGAKLLEFEITNYGENAGFYQWIKEVRNNNLDLPAKFLTLLTDKGRLLFAVYNTEGNWRKFEIHSYREHVQLEGTI